ncbi:enoyl-CoA hydratase/isomerase family protein [Flavivirga eckloniae]|uniref:Enoyl-CoA hydratase/isomerase family protein n=1 Tax=Flavivirga eckloniae TaxID=1803846 RepID=A0A2K9PR23_9FLAO|nr:enoyl-CoA hydratase/isomerase family protein [Flavivirga eckloniae]AUP79523.1 enoyl-CoA hydratase/isomerase family protein [Flavivirga eckloniae]
MSKNYKNIEIKIENGIGVLTFNRPDQLNAMNRETMDEIIDGIEEINSNNEAKVAVITGAGRAFMAGADIKEYGSQTPEQFKSFQQRGEALYESIENAPKPWIAAVNGYALGGGFEIALSCDMIVASEEAKMGLPEVFLSLVPGGGGTQRLIQKIGINRAKEILYTGGQYSAEALFDWGIINHVFEAKTFEDDTLRFAGKLTRRPSKAIKELKRLAHLSLSHLPFNQRLAEECKTVSELYYSEEAQKAIRDFIDKA